MDVTKVVYYPIDAAVPATLRGQLAATQNALGHITRFESYDLFGNVTWMVDPNGVATERTYDGLGRLLTSTLKGHPGCNTTADPLCATDIVTNRTYFGAGPLATETRPEGGVTKYEYDSEARVSAVTRGPSLSDQRERIETDYDPVSGKKSAERVRAFEGGAWVTKKSESFTYDDDAQMVAVTHADGSSVASEGTLYTTQQYRFDSDRHDDLQLQRRRHARVHDDGGVARHYDALGRTIYYASSVRGGHQENVSWGYDNWAGLGRLASMSDPSGFTAWYYTRAGQMRVEQRNIAAGGVGGTTPPPP